MVGSEVAGGLFSPWSVLECTFGVLIGTATSLAVRRYRRGDNEELLRPVLLSKKRHMELVFCTRELPLAWPAHALPVHPRK